MKKPDAPKLTEPQILAALRARFAAPEWAFLEQVRSRTGYQGAVRTADALAMSLWPGRGLELHGIEVKVSRADWKREKEEPAKAEEIQRHCDRWWLAIGDETIVQPGELPPTWGLLAPDPSPRAAGALRIVTTAPKLEAGPMPRAFLAAILRNVDAAKRGMVTREEIDGLVKAARAEGREQGEHVTAGGAALDALGEVRRIFAEDHVIPTEGQIEALALSLRTSIDGLPELTLHVMSAWSDAVLVASIGRVVRAGLAATRPS